MQSTSAGCEARMSLRLRRNLLRRRAIVSVISHIENIFPFYDLKYYLILFWLCYRVLWYSSHKAEQFVKQFSSKILNADYHMRNYYYYYFLIQSATINASRLSQCFGIWRRTGQQWEGSSVEKHCTLWTHYYICSKKATTLGYWSSFRMIQTSPRLRNTMEASQVATVILTFLLHTTMTNTSLYIVADSIFTRDRTELKEFFLIVVALMSTSLILLLAVIIVYSTVAKLRTTHGKNVLTLSICFVIVYIGK